MDSKGRDDLQAEGAIDLFPTPRYEDDCVRVAMEAGKVSYRERMAKHSTACYRRLRVRNLTDGWMVVRVEFAYDRSNSPEGLPPGGETQILVQYSFESFRADSAPYYSKPEDPRGTVTLHGCEGCPDEWVAEARDPPQETEAVLVPSTWISQGRSSYPYTSIKVGACWLRGLFSGMPLRRFRFDVTCHEGESRVTVI